MWRALADERPSPRPEEGLVMAPTASRRVFALLLALAQLLLGCPRPNPPLATNLARSQSSSVNTELLSAGTT